MEKLSFATTGQRLAIYTQVFNVRRLSSMNVTRLLFVGLILFGFASATAKASPRAHHLAKQRTPAPTATPTATVVPDSEEEQRYQQAKTAAKVDPAIQALKARADAATSEKEARETTIAYYRALFGKIKQLDATVSERAELVENAIIRRVNE